MFIQLKTMNNLLLLVPFFLMQIGMAADFHHAWWWYLCFCALPIIYLFIFAYLKHRHEINEEDDTYTY